MRTRFFFPPLPKLSGGLAVIAAMAGHLVRAGHDAALVLREPRPGLEALVPGVPLLAWEGLALGPEDLWVVPEGWPNALTPGLHAGARCLVYVQNWGFMHGQLPPGVRWSSLPVSFLAVSQPVAWYVRETTGAMPEILRPGIDTARFAPQDPTGATVARPVDGPVRVAWMPRKNKALAQLIRMTAEARAAHPLEWVEIHGRSPDEVAALLRSADVFLATGFPEGCPLPPLEALASGCMVVGFSGLGGWDYMRQALPEGFAGRFEPWWPRRAEAETPWGGNGFYVADADVVAAAGALEYAASLARLGGPERLRLFGAALRTAAHYSLEAQREAVLALWRRAEAGEIWR